MAERKSILLRLDPAVHDALAKWAADEMRSTNAQIEFLLRRALGDAGRMPGSARAMRRPGRPAADQETVSDEQVTPASVRYKDPHTERARVFACPVTPRPAAGRAAGAAERAGSGRIDITQYTRELGLTGLRGWLAAVPANAGRPARHRPSEPVRVIPA